MNRSAWWISLPTFLDAANAQTSEIMHGKSLLPYLINDEPLNRPFINGGRERHGYDARQITVVIRAHVT